MSLLSRNGGPESQQHSVAAQSFFDVRRSGWDSVLFVCDIMFGVLNLNKPPGITSRDVVNIVQRIVRPLKVGHAGTLDPMATGVLLVCVGKATRLISLLQQSSKTYVADFRLGVRSDTDDSTGEVQAVDLNRTPPSENEIRRALESFVGTIEQVPPAYSAVRIDGRRAYAKARSGEVVTLTAKTVVVHRIELQSYVWPQLTVEIECGSGTYIRSIARDLGRLLECGGLMSALERTKIGDFAVAEAGDANTLTAENVAQHLIDPVHLVSHLRQYRCSDEERNLLRAGRAFEVNNQQLVGNVCGTDDAVAMTDSSGAKLLAMGEVTDGSQLQPRLVFIE